MNATDLLDLPHYNSTNCVVCSYCSGTNVRNLGPCSTPVELTSENVLPVIRQVAEKVRHSNLYECLNCQLVFRWPQLSGDELGCFYRDLPKGYWVYDPKTVGSWVTAKRFLTSAYDSSQSIRILDIGAFDGSFLRTLPDRWQKAAVEPSVNAQKALQQEGITHLGDFIDDPKIQHHAGTFDVVTMFDVFEHLPSPQQSLAAIMSLLKPGGRLLISTGNAHHWTWRLMRGQHWYLHSTQHLNFGSKAFFTRYCDDSETKLDCILCHSHRLQGTAAIFRQALEALHFWGKQSKTLIRRVLARLIQSAPWMQHLIHRTTPPFGTALSDHLLAVLQRPKTGNRGDV